MISVFILTKNEEQDLPGCLEAISWCDDVHVFDSYSSDRTVAIAEAAGAKVTKRHFDDWSQHQNWAIRNLPFRHPWVLYLDADERVTPDLRRSIQSAVQSPNGNVAFLIQRRDFFLGRWLKHVQATSQYMRLFRPEKMSYHRLSHPVSTPGGPVGQLTGYLNHYPFSKGMAHWFVKHNGYSTLESRQIISDREDRPSVSIGKAIFCADPIEKRFHQKELFYRFPARPIVKFFLLYIAKRGFLDGRAGLTYAALQSIYEYMIILKTRELMADPAIESIPQQQPNTVVVSNSHT